MHRIILREKDWTITFKQTLSIPAGTPSEREVASSFRIVTFPQVKQVISLDSKIEKKNNIKDLHELIYFLLSKHISKPD